MFYTKLGTDSRIMGVTRGKREVNNRKGGEWVKRFVVLVGRSSVE